MVAILEVKRYACRVFLFTRSHVMWISFNNYYSFKNIKVDWLYIKRSKNKIGNKNWEIKLLGLYIINYASNISSCSIIFTEFQLYLHLSLDIHLHDGKTLMRDFYQFVLVCRQVVIFLLHTDLFGPVSLASINEKKYGLLIVNDYSRWTWIKFLITKDEVYDVFSNFYTQI